ncbi:MAG: hypothetical protein ACUVQ1_05290 [Candidatus Kapaibacteriales bacterium]
MKQNLIIAVFLLWPLFFFTTILGQEWQWAISGKGNSFDYPLALVTDSQNNLYVAGYFQSSSLKFGNITLLNKGGEDIFLGKFTPSGDVVWLKGFGGSRTERGTCLALDSNGYLYLAGYFESSDIQFGQKTLTPVGGWDIFISKFDPSGEIVWVKTFGSENYEEPTSIACSNNSIALTGEFSGKSIQFDNYTIINQSNEGISDIFITKLSFDGNPLWAKGIGGSSFERPHYVLFDHNQNIYLACSYNSNMIFFGSDSLINKGYSDVFLIKYSTDGEPLWVRNGGGRDKDFLSSMAIDSKDNLVLTGFTLSNDFKFADNFIFNSGSYDFFIIKFSPDGTVQWHNNFGNLFDDYATTITIDTDDFIYVGGSFASDTLRFTQSVFLNNSANNNTSEIFLSKFSPDGTPIWAISAQGVNEDHCTGITLDNDRNLYAIGYFRSKDIYFGSIDLFNMGYSNIFISKLYKTLNSEKNEIHTPYQFFILDNQLILDYKGEKITHDVSLYDSFGRTIFQQKSNENIIVIPLTNLSYALYLLQFGDSIRKIILP